MYLRIKVNNVPSELLRYTVVRLYDCKCWYWGTYDNRDRAIMAATEVNGVIIEKTEEDEACTGI